MHPHLQVATLIVVVFGGVVGCVVGMFYILWRAVDDSFPSLFGTSGENKMASEKARHIAARVWCDQDMSGVVMDVDAAERIAVIVDEVLAKQGEDVEPHVVE